jgi:hypothetical protein
MLLVVVNKKTDGPPFFIALPFVQIFGRTLKELLVRSRKIV